MFNRLDGKVDIKDPEKSQLELDAAAFAEQTRKRLGVSMHEPIDVITLVEGDGVYVFQIKNLGCSGFVRVFNEQRVIFVNASEPLGRQHYTIAHEYCHILRDLKSYISLKELPPDKYEYEMNRIEYFAFKFADSFLLPQPAIFHALNMFDISDYEKISAQDILRIQHHFGVSYLQMLRMLRRTHVLSESQHSEFKMLSTKEDPQRLVRITSEYGFSPALISPMEHSRIPSGFMQVLVDNTQNRRLTHRKVKHLEGLLGIPLKHLIPELGQGGEDE
jgi:Zn-dependent peptidase ImmA (M78 family)